VFAANLAVAVLRVSWGGRRKCIDILGLEVGLTVEMWSVMIRNAKISLRRNVGGKDLKQVWLIDYAVT
jgi:hypothetical protein